MAKMRKYPFKNDTKAGIRQIGHHRIYLTLDDLKGLRKNGFDDVLGMSPAQKKDMNAYARKRNATWHPVKNKHIFVRNGKLHMRG